ncbi:MAG: hypothetical protein JWO15_3850 [Sphingomonadales bacterium]|nr:hypothetical protein [Sphingomonadales bacterium]
MDLGEAVRLAEILLSEPDSHAFVAAQGWDFPASREWLLAASHYDAYVQATWKNAKPYARPWPNRTTEKRGKTSLTQDEVTAALRMAGHDLPIPTRTTEV